MPEKEESSLDTAYCPNCQRFVKTRWLDPNKDEEIIIVCAICGTELGNDNITIFSEEDLN